MDGGAEVVLSPGGGLSAPASPARCQQPTSAPHATCAGRTRAHAGHRAAAAGSGARAAGTPSAASWTGVGWAGDRWHCGGPCAGSSGGGGGGGDDGEGGAARWSPESEAYGGGGRAPSPPFPAGGSLDPFGWAACPASGGGSPSGRRPPAAGRRPEGIAGLPSQGPAPLLPSPRDRGTEDQRGGQRGGQGVWPGTVRPRDSTPDRVGEDWLAGGVACGDSDDPFHDDWDGW